MATINIDATGLILWIFCHLAKPRRKENVLRKELYICSTCHTPASIVYSNNIVSPTSTSWAAVINPIQRSIHVFPTCSSVARKRTLVLYPTYFEIEGIEVRACTRSDALGYPTVFHS